jgi:hypothetical protein
MVYNRSMKRVPVFGYVIEVECAPVRPLAPALLLSALLGILVFWATGAILVLLPLSFRVKCVIM